MKKIKYLLTFLIIFLSFTCICTYASARVLEITDDFENGVNTSVWRNDAKGLIIKNAPIADDNTNNAAFIDKTNRLRNYLCSMTVKENAIIDFDLMIDPNSTSTSADEFLNLYGKDSSNALITTARLLSYSPTKNILYVNGKANANYPLEKGQWCHVTVDIDIENALYCVYVNGDLLVNLNGATQFTWNYTSDTKGAFGPGSTLTEAEMVCRATGSSMYVDNITIAQRMYADPDCDFGFYNINGDKTSVLDPIDTVYKATIVNNGLTDEEFVLYIAGYDASENTLETLAVKEYRVNGESNLNIEEHIKYLSDDANSMIYKAFYVKDTETLEPLSKNTLIIRSEAMPAEEIVSDDNYKHVVIIGVDGMGTFSRNHSEANERIESLFDGGAVTYDMEVSVPTVSAHSWASCLTGVTPDLHGLNSNSLVEKTPREPDSDYPTILKIAADEYAQKGTDADVASIAVWNGINVGIVETSDNIYKFKSNDSGVGTEVVRYITEDVSSDTPTLLYVHFNCPDAYGHSKGYGTASHLNEINYVSKMIVKINDALKNKGMLDDTLFIVTADHGGTTVYKDDGTPYGEHGGLSDTEKYAIFAAKGKTVVADGTIDNIEIRDTAAIALYALGLDIPSYMSARVPSNLFEGVPETQRSVYFDRNNPRYHVPVSTPKKGSADYVTNYVSDKNLIAYLPFDGNANALVGKAATENGTIEYVPGYFGNGVCLNEGYLSLDDFAPGEDSFTISMWIKSAMAYKDAPILTNKNWETKTDKGYCFYLSRGGDGPHYFGVNIADGTKSFNKNDFVLPSDYDRGWMHVMLIVDREAGTVSVCNDFDTTKIYSISESIGSVNLTSDAGKLCIGDDIDGDYTFKMGLSVDEFMVFDGAFDEENINSMKEYYNK